MIISPTASKLAILSLLSILLLISGCNSGNTPIPFPHEKSEFEEPVSEPLVFSEPKPMNLVAITPENSAAPTINKIDINTFPSKPFYPDGFLPIKSPVKTSSFNFSSLRDSVFNWDEIPFTPLKVQTSIIKPPRIVKAGLPRPIKNAALGIFEFNEDQGLPGAIVLSLMEDSHGMLWLATDKGLCRFDGEYFEIYSFIESIFTGSQANVSKIIEDPQGRIWINTDLRGIYVLDTRSGIVSNFFIPKSPLNINNEMILDSQGLVWTGNNNSGIYVIDPANFSAKIISSNNEQRIGDGRQLLEDTQGNLWVRQSRAGLRIINRKKGSITFLNQDTCLSSNIITGLFEDQQNRIWVSTTEGIDVIDTENLLVRHLGKAQGINEIVNHFADDDQGNIWMSTDGGLYVYQEGAEKIRQINSNQGLSNNRVTTLFNDSKGQLWIATGGGLNMIDTKGIMPTYLTEKDGLGTGDVWSFLKDEQDRLWIGTMLGVDIYNPASHTIQSIPNNILLSKGPTVSYDVIPSKNGKILLFARGSGFTVIDPKVGSSTNVTRQQGLANTFPASFMEDQTGKIWTGSFGRQGIEIIDLEKNTFTHIKNENGLKGNIVWEMKEINPRMILVSTDSAVNIINPVDGTISYLMQGDKVRKLSGASIIVDKEGKIWVSEREGILILDEKNKRLTTFGPNNGLVAPDVYTLYQHNDRIYAGTGNGLTVFNPKESETFSSTTGFNWDFKSYSRYQGMLYNNYNANGAIYFENRFWWGIEDKALTITNEPTFENDSSKTFISGITITDVNPSFYDPSWIQNNKVIGDTVWNEQKDTLFLKNDLQINSRWLSSNKITWDTVAGHYNLPTNLKIPFGLNYLSFRFSGSQLSNRDKTRYRYILEGIDDDWSPITSASYSKNYRDLPAGNYTFKVASKGFNGVWSQPASFSFAILPPWYNTWYAYLLYVGVLSLLVWSIVQYRSRQLMKENLVLEKRVEHRTQQLNKSIEDLKATQSQLIQSEKMASLGELTAGIAHEIQNPLNFVNNFAEVNVELLKELTDGPLNHLTQEDRKEADTIVSDLKQNLEKIAHHGKRADAIVKSMLQHSRSSSGKKELTDINALTDEYLRLAYHGLRAKDKSFNAIMKTDFDEDIEKVNIISQDIGRVVLNLITNAFYSVAEKKKQLQNNYEPTVTVSTRKSESNIEIAVKDNGNGIPQAIMDKIFQPFFTTKPTGQGTGLGLSMSYDIIKTHGGELKVMTKEGEETVFIIQLPI